MAKRKPNLRKRIWSEEARKRKSEITRKLWQNPEFREKMIKAHKGSLGKHWKLSEETKERMRKAAKERLKRKEVRIKLSKSHQGEKCYRWKGGVTRENKKIRQNIEFRLWREAVFARDNWTCQKCGARSGNGKEVYLHPHHLQNFAAYPELRFAIDNGITLCRDCHKKFHKKYGFTKNTKEQIWEFLGLKENL